MSAVLAPSGIQRDMQLQSANNSLQNYTEQRESLHMLQGAMERAGWLSAGRIGRMADVLVAHHSRRDEGILRPSQHGRHSFVVAVEREGEETWIVDRLLLEPLQDLAVSFQREGFIVGSVERAWTHKVARGQNCAYLAVKTASSFM